MQLSNAPAKVYLPFANSGAKNTIPVPSQIGTTPGAASFTDGFPPLTRTPIAAGGIPPLGQDFNGIFYQLSAPVRWAALGGGYIYDAAFATDSNVGGYPKGARLLRSDGLGYWRSTIDNNQNDPEGATQPSGWEPDGHAGTISITLTNANVTLTPLQSAGRILSLTGVLTANVNLIVPDMNGQWEVVNGCTGAFSVTVKTASGAGVAIPAGAGYRTKVWTNGATGVYADTNYVPTQTAGNNSGLPASTAYVDGAVAGIVGNAGKYINLQVSAPGTNATISASADSITVYSPSTGKYFTFYLSPVTCNMGVAGAGGLDTGSTAANTWYCLHAILNPTTSAFTLLASLSASPTLPSGYTYFKRIGMFRTDASGWPMSGVQADNVWQWKVNAATNVPAPIAVASGSTGSTTPNIAVSIRSGYAPPNAGRVRGHVYCPMPTAAAYGIAIAPNNSYTLANAPVSESSAAGGYATVINLSLPFDFVLESQYIYWGNNVTGSVCYIDGWVDNI